MIPQHRGTGLNADGTEKTVEQILKPLNDLEAHRKDTLARNSVAFYQVICVDAPVNKIPESMFVNEMLPFLFEEIPEFAQNDPTLQMTSAKWIAAAGGPHAEFDVIDAAGVVLFRCPAYMTREMYDNEEAAKKGRISGMFVHTKQLSHQSPRRASAFSAEQFTDRGLSMNRGEVIKGVQKRWNEIFSRYNRPLLAFDEQVNQPVLTTEGSKSKGTSLSAADEGPIEYTNDGFEC